MKVGDSKLLELINNDSFVRWVNNTSSTSENKMWNQWLLKNTENQKMFLKAKKLISMPFNTTEAKYDVFNELKRLRSLLSNLTPSESFDDLGK